MNMHSSDQHFQDAPGNDSQHGAPSGASDPLLRVTSLSLAQEHLDDHGQIPNHLTSESTSPSPSEISFDSLEEASQEHPEPSPNMPCRPHADQAQPKRRGCTCLGIWYAEILSSLVAAICLSAIVATLRIHQGRPLPEWPFNITINALIAVFTAILKASLAMPIAEGVSQFKWLWFGRYRELADVERIDKASRGVWGSVLLLFTGRPQLSMIGVVNIGAVLTIALLAVDPFSQQIIQSAPCLQNVGTSAIIPKTQNYDRFAQHIGAGIETLDGPMQVAIYLGLLSPTSDSSTAVSTICPTGTCIFPADNGRTFSSLAMCQFCNDVSDTAISNMSTEADGSLTGFNTLPSGAKVELTIPFASTTWRYSGKFPLLGFDALMTKDVNMSESFAVSCVLNPCVKTYGANISDSIYSEDELDVNILTIGYNQGFSYSAAANKTLRNGIWHSCNPSAQNNSINTILVNTTTMTSIDTEGLVDLVIGPDALWYPVDCVWQFSMEAVDSMGAFLITFFSDKSLSSENGAPSHAYGDPWLVNLYRNGTATMDTVNTFMDGLAWSITATMRQNSNDADALRFVTGQILAMKTCLVVRWAWLSLPAALLGLEVTFLAVVIFVTRTSEHWGEDWKSSALALLFHGLERSSPREKEGGQSDVIPRSANGMMKAAKGVMVQLRKGDAGWQFVSKK